MELLSIIVPCYNEQETLGDYYKEIITVRDRLLAMECGLEVIFIDDGSRDGTLEDMKSLAGQNPWIKYLSFTRNFGKEAAIYAGLTHAKGDFVGLMDVDLQDPSSLIPGMVETLREEGMDALREAKRCHDQLEGVYHPYVDFDGVSRVAEEEIARIESYL